MSIVIMPIVNLSSLTKYTSSKCVYSLLNINIIAIDMISTETKICLDLLEA